MKQSIDKNIYVETAKNVKIFKCNMQIITFLEQVKLLYSTI